MNLFKIKTSNRTWWDIILWWELRRFLYNAIMAFVGFLSLVICSVNIPLVYLVIALLLNAIYTLGWIVELIYIRNQSNENRKFTYPKSTFVTYLILSCFFVSGVAFYFLFGL